MTRRISWYWVAAGFLALSYGLAAPLTAYLEYQNQTLSERFGYSPELIYLTCAVQVICAGGVFIQRFAPWAAALLTVITLGAIVSHLKIGSPLTTLPAIVYTVVQVWFGIRSYKLRSSP